MRKCLFLISASVIYLQISLIRSLSNIYYGALTYFIISLALLGFGASGTFLYVKKKRMRFNSKNQILIILFYCASLFLTFYLTSYIKLNLLYLFYETRQLFLLFFLSVILFFPFFFSGLFIGYLLINVQNKEIHYGINLLGSGVGGLAALGTMYFFLPIQLSQLTLIFVLPVLIIQLYSFKPLFVKIMIIPGILITVFILYFSPVAKPDQYKDIYQYQLLENQGQAGLISQMKSPFGLLEAWESSLDHATLFAGLSNDKEAPSQLSLLNDGNYLSPFFMIARSSEAEILDNTIQSLPYRIIKNANVLLVGDFGLVNLWLALRFNAENITVLLPNLSMKKFLEENLKLWTENLNSMKNVTIIADDYRRFFALNQNQFDIIHFVSAESLKGSMSGLYTFQEDYSITVETFKAAWNSLSEQGLISLSKGIHLPAKDNLKILMSFYKSAKELKMENPQNHLAQMSNYLAAVTILSKMEFDQHSITRLEEKVEDLNLNIEFYPGDGLFYRERVRSSIYDVRPSTDDRPFYASFFKWSSINELYDIYGPYWFREADLGYLILIITLLFITCFAFLSILLPHFLMHKKINDPFLYYFPMIGAAFMFIEIVFIQKMALFLGHVSISVSLVLTSLLLSSGLGSICIKKIQLSLRKKMILAVSVISAINLYILIFSDQIIYINSCLSRIHLGLSWGLMSIFCLFCGFFMGWFFAPALGHLEKSNKDLMPMAWALNGFTSVAASPLAVLLSISYGFFIPVLLAVFLYSAAGFLFIESRNIDN